MQLTRLLRDESARAEQLVWIDHREAEDSIVDYVSAAIGRGSDLACEWQDDAFCIRYRGQRFHVPLTMSQHDRYVAISSLATILQADYEFWIETNSLDGDTHGLLIARVSEVEALSPNDRAALTGAFTKLEIGRDYFSGLEVPCVGQPDANPNLEQQSAAQHAASKALVEQVLASPEAKGALQQMKAELSRLFGLGNRK